MLKSGGLTHLEGLSFIKTDLSSDQNWDEAVKGAEYVIHVASPTPNKVYKDENEMIGPILGNDYSHSNGSVRQMLEGKMKSVPKIYSDYVDVQDVANILRKHLVEDAKNAPKGEIPNIVVRVMALCNPQLRMIASLLGLDMSTSNQKAKQLLGWKPRLAEEAITATGKSIMKIIKGR
jgi:nucleoside-diphosphate-sugar epimerase